MNKDCKHYFVLLVDRVNLDNATCYKTKKEAMKAFWKHANSNSATGAILFEITDDEAEMVASYAW